MNCETRSLKSIEEAVNLSGQQNIEADIVLPDYYDSIGKILKCDVVPMVEALNITGDKVSVSGSAKFVLLYTGEDKNIYRYENDYKYTKVFQTPYNEKYVCSRLKQEVFSVNYKAQGPKRIEFRSVLMISAVMQYVSEKSVVCDIPDENIITRKSTIDMMNPVTAARREFSVSQSFDISEYAQGIKSVYRSCSRLKVDEIKPIHNKMYIKGSVDTEIIYLYECDEGVRKYSYSMPFSEIVDIFGLEDDDICKLTHTEIYTDVQLKTENQSDAGIDIRCNVCFDIQCSRNECVQFVSDAYSVKNELHCDTQCCYIATDEENITRTETICFDVDLYDDNASCVCDVSADALKATVERKGGKFIVLVSGTYSVLIKDTQDCFSVICKEHTFEAELCDADKSISVKSAAACLLSATALRIDRSKLRLTCDVFIDALVLKRCEVNCFTDVSVDEAVCKDKNNGYVVYFACKNEQLWEIAKENKTTVELIKSVNNIRNDFVEDNIMLLLPYC